MSANPNSTVPARARATSGKVKSRRRRERIKLTIPARVTGREGAQQDWTEMTRLIDVTPFGARFVLRRMVEPGRLLHLFLAMPRPLRCFDHAEDQYRVWALVRNVKWLPGHNASPPGLEVGVAFVGKHPPAGFTTAPTSRYGVKSSSDGNCSGSAQERSAHDKTRKRSDHTRLDLPVEVTVELLDEKGQVVAREDTVTENISRRGAAVFTKLQAEKGRYLTLTNIQSQLSALTAVRACHTGADGITRLHLEFVDREWPLDGVA